MLSAIWDGSFNCLIVLIVSLETFLFIEVNFSILLIAVTANGYKSSSPSITSLWGVKSQVINFSLSLKSIIFTLRTPSTKTFTVPSGSFKSCKMLPSHPYINISVFLGSSISEFFWVTKIIFFSFFITSFKAEIDLSLPTKSGITMLGKTTISLSGNNGEEVFTSIKSIWILKLFLQYLFTSY